MLEGEELKETGDIFKPLFSLHSIALLSHHLPRPLGRLHQDGGEDALPEGEEPLGAVHLAHAVGHPGVVDLNATVTAMKKVVTTNQPSSPYVVGRGLGRRRHDDAGLQLESRLDQV